MGFALWSDGRDGWDRCTMTAADGGRRLHGQVRRGDAHGGGWVHYDIRVDDAWAVTSATFEADGRTLELSRDGEAWTVDGEVHQDLHGCLDLDLDFTPAAVAPWFRRLDLAPGQSAEHDVVHVGLDGFVVKRVAAEVAHLDEYHWSLDVRGEHARIHLGAAGLVVEHDAGWSAMAVG